MISGAAAVHFKKAQTDEEEDVNDDHSVGEPSLDGSVSSLEEGIEIVDDSGNLIYPTAPEGGTPYNEEDGALNPGWGYDENNNPVWVGANYIDPTIDPNSDYYRDMTDVTEDPDYWTGQDSDYGKDQEYTHGAFDEYYNRI